MEAAGLIPQHNVVASAFHSHHGGGIGPTPLHFNPMSHGNDVPLCDGLRHRLIQRENAVETGGDVINNPGPARATDGELGLPFFHPLYDPSTKLILWSGHTHGRMTTRELIGQFISPPWFPVSAEYCTSNLHCRDFVPGDVLAPRTGMVVRTGSLSHPGGCVGYRVEANGKSVALISDTEHVAGVLDPVVLDLIADADLVIYDSTYLESEMERYRGFGHSTWEQGIKLCKAAGAKRLALFHHDPSRTDSQVEEIERAAQARFSGAFAARDGLILDL